MRLSAGCGGRASARLHRDIRETATRSWPELLFRAAIDAPGRGWRISGFGLLLIAAVLIVALLKATAVFGGGAFAGGVSKVVKLVQKKPAAPKPDGQSG